MRKAKDGGPAYPVPNDGKEGDKGMSLRDYFAGQALVGNCSCDSWRVDADYEQTAESAYKMADAMLKAREKPVA